MRDNGAESVQTNNVIDLITNVQIASIWSVLDQHGTQNMMSSALGRPVRLTDYDTVKRRLLASDYIMNFNNGVAFDLNIKTTYTVTASTISA